MHHTSSRRSLPLDAFDVARYDQGVADVPPGGWNRLLGGADLGFHSGYLSDAMVCAVVVVVDDDDDELLSWNSHFYPKIKA